MRPLIICGSLNSKLRAVISEVVPENKERADDGRAWWLMPAIPALWEAKVSGSVEVRSLRPAWPTWQNPISTKNTKISQAWWQATVIPAT